MKRILSLFLTICLIMGIVGALPVQAADNFEEEYGISYNDLFMKYPAYLHNATSEEIIRNATDAYNDVIAKYDENDELISALKSGASDGLDIIIKNIGSALGLTDSYYDDCMDKAILALMQEIYSDAESVADLAFVKESAKQFEWIKTAADVSTATIDIAASNMKNLTRDDVEEITKTINGNYSKVLDPATDMVDLAKYIYTACVIEDVQIELIDLLIEKADKDGELYKGLNRLRNDMIGGIAQYTLSAFIENKLLSEISLEIMEFGWNALDISTGSVVIGKLIMKTAVWVLFDVIFPHPDADDVIANMILTMYVNEISVVLINQRTVFDKPFYVSDMQEYKTLYNMYLSCINATMDSTMKLAETTGDEGALENAKKVFNSSLPNYDSYINNCLFELSGIPEEDRVKRTISTSDYINISNDDTIIASVFDGETPTHTDELPLTSENSTLWNVYISNGTLISGNNVIIPELNANGTLDVRGDLYIEYDLQQSKTIELNGGKMFVGWDYTNNGTLMMEDDSDYVLVNGKYEQYWPSYTSGSENSYKYLTAGTLEVKGNFDGNDYYRPTGTHKTILSGNALQNVGYATFNILELCNTSEDGIYFYDDDTWVTKELYSVNSNIENGRYLLLRGNTKIRNNVLNHDIGISGWVATEENTINGNVYDYYSNYGTTEINAPQHINGNLELQREILNVNGDMNIGGNLTQSNGNTINLNKHRLSVQGNYTNSGILMMEDDSDYVLVNGKYEQSWPSSTSGSENSYKYLTAGTLEVKGNFDGNDYYRPTGTHKTILSGNALQNVGYATFNILELCNTSEDGIHFDRNSNVLVNILQPIGTSIKNSYNLYIQGTTAFKDCEELNAAINLYNGNAENVVPTWVDYENYSGQNTKITSITIDGIKAENSEDEWNIMMPYGTASVVKEQIIVNIEDEAATYEINSSDVQDTWIIKVTSKNGLESKDYTLNISYDPVNHVSGIYMDKTEAAINVGEELSLTVSFMPEDATYKTLTWKSSNENVAKVENGVVTAINKGTATITAISNNGLETTCEVTVLKPSTAIRLNKSKVSLGVCESLQLSTIMTPADSTDLISWSSSDENIAKVTEKGLVSAISTGNVIITATTTSGASAHCNINIYDSSNEVTSVTISENEIYLAPNDAKQLVVNVLPEDAVDAVVTWSSSNEDVAVVDESGMVTAVANGITIIKVMTANGIYDECVVKVVSVSDASVLLTSEKASPNGTVQVKASLVKNPGISGYKFTVNYDDTILTPVAVTPNSEFGGSIATNLEDSNRHGLNIVWYANKDIDINGELFTIDFKVSDSAEYGDTSSVSLEYGAKDICNTAGEYFALYIDDATISIEEPIPGDIYEDGEVTIYDLTLLSRYITSLETFTERQEEAADVNNDGLVDILDVIRLAQYLAGWSDVELMSLGLFSLRGTATPVITVGSASVNAANEAEIPVYIKGNTGIAAYRFVLDYNADDIEILSITPSDLIDKDAFNTNLGAESQATDGLIVTSRTSGGNMTEDGALFTIKVRYKNPVDTFVSPISIIDSFNNIGNENATYVTATYETGYALGSDYIVANKVVGDTNFSCELYFDDSYAKQSAKAIIAFYDADGRMVQLMPKDLTVKSGKVDLSIDYDKKAYATYKLMIWEGMNSLKPITDVK